MADTYTQQNDTQSGNAGTTVGAMTLTDSLKLDTDTLRKGVVELFIRENPILQRLPWMEIAGNSLLYDYEVALPGVGFRSVNEGYTVKHGTVGQRAVGLAIFGGDLDVDRFIIKTRSTVNDQRAIQEGMQVLSMSKTFQKMFFDGARTTSGNEEFDGVNTLLADAYHTSAGAAGTSGATVDMAHAAYDEHDAIATNGVYAKSSTTGVDNLMNNLDIAIDSVIGGTANKVILMNKTLRRSLTKQARSNAQITIDKDQWGYQVFSYGGVPILEIEDDAAGSQILGFDETVGSSTTTSSFYVARFEAGYVQGLQNGGMDVRDLGELEALPVYRTRVEWFCAVALMHPRAMTRVKGWMAAYQGDNV
jgi:hypothetical protein